VLPQFPALRQTAAAQYNQHSVRITCSGRNDIGVCSLQTHNLDTFAVDVHLVANCVNCTDGQHQLRSLLLSVVDIQQALAGTVSCGRCSNLARGARLKDLSQAVSGVTSLSRYCFGAPCHN
jgi:hypothetical protein